MSARVGSLFSGYGGLDMGVTAALGGSVAWHVEYDNAPSKILAHHWPDVPNYGDVTAVDWSQVDPVDVITGGSPCQDLSHAGKRQGMTEGTRSNLWVAMREAIAQLRPAMVVWENVRGAYSAAADSEVEPCAGCVGDGSGVHLRALGRVLGDLSDLGYDCRWHGLRAADVGAPHGRFRVFVVASLADSERGGWLGREVQLRGLPGQPARNGAGAGTLLPTPTSSDTNGAGHHGDGGLDLRMAVSLLPTPVARDWKGAGPADMNRHDPNLSAIGALLPTPAVNDMGEGKTPEARDEWLAKMQAAHGNGNGHGKSLAIEAQRLEPKLLPTIKATNNENRPTPGFDNGGEVFYHILRDDRWGEYADAIARWEALTRPAPPPTQLSEAYLKMRAKRVAGLDKRPVGRRGSLRPTPQLSPAFSEWLMGLPAGHVTDVPGLSRNDQLKALGNGVVPQQAEAALRFLLSVERAA